jgi:hypothetical protein
LTGALNRSAAGGQGTATVTGSILVGNAHPNDGGICPTHQLLLSENDRPAWSLYMMPGAKAQAAWIPTLENMLEDGILMAGLLVVRDPALVAAAAAFRGNHSERAEMYDDISESDRFRLYELCRAIGPETKLVVSVLEGSTLANQLAILGRYSVGVEVCQSI